jgi:hypothetical protein
MDDGSDWQFILNSEFAVRNEEDPWRKRIKWPDQEPLEQVEELLPLLQEP